MNYNEKLIEEAAKALTALTDAEWEIATGEGTEHLTGYFDAARRVLAVFEKAHTPTDDGRIAPEDGMTLEELGEAISNWSPAWDGDDAMHSLVYRFLEHYAALDSEVYAAREEHDFEPDAEILFRYDDEAGTLVRVPQDEPSGAQVKANAQSYAADRYREVIYLSEYNAAVSAFVEGVEWARAARGAK